MRHRAGAGRSSADSQPGSRELARVEASDAKDYPVVYGGRRLAGTRRPPGQGRSHRGPVAHRLVRGLGLVGCAGNAGKPGGNPACLTLARGEGGRWYLTVSVPRPVAEQLGVASRVQAGAPVVLHRRSLKGSEERLDAPSAVRLDVAPDTDSKGRRRTYLRVSWVRPTIAAVDLAAARAGGVVGVDLNADHLAATRIDPAGNPVGRPVRVPPEPGRGVHADPGRAAACRRHRRPRARQGHRCDRDRRSRTSTSPTPRPARSSDAASSSGTRSPGSRPPSSRTGSSRWRTPRASRSSRSTRATPAGRQHQVAAPSCPPPQSSRPGASVAIGTPRPRARPQDQGRQAWVAESAARSPPERWKQHPHPCGSGTGNHRHGRGHHPGRRPPTTRSRTTVLPAPTPSLGCGHA